MDILLSVSYFYFPTPISPLLGAPPRLRPFIFFPVRRYFQFLSQRRREGAIPRTENAKLLSVLDIDVDVDKYILNVFLKP